MEKSSVEVSLVEKVCELQREVCEYERFLADLLIVLIEKDVDRCDVKYEVRDDNLMCDVRNEVEKLLLARDLKGKEDTK